MFLSDNRLLDEATQLVELLLPPGWRVERRGAPGSGEAGLRFVSSEGRSRVVPVVLRQRLDPRGAAQVPSGLPRIVVARYLSKTVRERLEQRGIGFVDCTGNMRLVLDDPGLFVLAAGAETNPWPDKRRFSLRGVKAGHVVQALAARRPPSGVRELAELTDVDPGYVSRLLRMLDREAIVERTSRGQVERVDWRRLVTRWAADAPLEQRAEATTWLAPRGWKRVIDQLGVAEFRYALTGSMAASRVAPVAPTRLLSLYVDDPEQVAQQLGLRPASAGANVVLLQTADDTILQHATEVEGLRQVAMPLVVADLMTGPGRSPAEAEALMDWMDEHEEAWRG